MSETRVIIDFHGEQGVGKTLLATSIWRFLNKNGIQVIRREKSDRRGDRDTLEVVLTDEDRKRVFDL